MTEILLSCRLCISSRSEFKSLYDENGQSTIIYQITLRYFDPMLLHAATGKQYSSVICTECWQHIYDFYGFQESIIDAQSKLQNNLSDDVTQFVCHIKEEEEPVRDTPNVPQDTADPKDENVGMFDDNIYETVGIKENNPFTSDDDDKPLIFHKTKHKTGVKTKNLRHQKCLTTAKTLKATAKLKHRKKDKKTSKSKIEDKQISNETYLNPGSETKNISNKKTSRDKTKEFDAFIAEWKQELECASCPRTVANFDELREHFHAEHPNESTCFAKCCERKFSKRFYLFEHLQLHLKPDTYKCNICGKCNSSSRNLAKHVQERHTDEGKKRPFGCDICQKKFTNKFTLRRHTELHESSRDHKCHECGKGFATEQRRKVHERMVHDVDRVCEECGKQVHGVYALRQHLLEHKGVEKRKYSCDLCDTLLTSNASLKRHKEQKHHDGTTAYICRECGKIFNSHVALMRHKKIVHIIERKYKCNICEKAFKFPQYLREHMASHTGIDLYECPHCPKTFKVRSNLHHHRKRVHTKEWLEARVSKLQS